MLNQIGEFLKSYAKSTKVLIVTDTFVNHRYTPVVSESLKNAGFDIATFDVPTGEGSKSLEQLSQILDSLMGI